MGAQSPVPKDHPLMLAWEAYKATDDFKLACRWAVTPTITPNEGPLPEYASTNVEYQYLGGSLWAAFVAGFEAGREIEHKQAQDEIAAVRQHAAEMEKGAYEAGGKQGYDDGWNEARSKYE